MNFARGQSVMAARRHQMRMSPVLVFIHVSAGLIALPSGMAALMLRKGSRAHALAGRVFFVSMLIMAALGAYGSIVNPDMTNLLAGVVTFYLVATAWMTVRRKAGESGLFEIGACAVPFACSITALTFAWQVVNDGSRVSDGAPPFAYYMFASVSVLAAAGDFRVVLRRGIAGSGWCGICGACAWRCSSPQGRSSSGSRRCSRSRSEEHWCSPSRRSSPSGPCSSGWSGSASPEGTR